jgi:hypothetical protein
MRNRARSADPPPPPPWRVSRRSVFLSFDILVIVTEAQFEVTSPPPPTLEHFRDAMAAPAALPEFAGNVAAVRTEVYWDKELSAAKAKEQRRKASVP